MKLNIFIVLAIYSLSANAGTRTDKFNANFINHTSLSSEKLDVVYSLNTYSASIGDGQKICRTEDIVVPLAHSISVCSQYLKGCGLLTASYNYGLSIKDKTNTSYYSYLNLANKVDVKNIQEKTYSLFELTHDQTVDIKTASGEVFEDWKSRNEVGYATPYLLIKDLKTGKVYEPLAYFSVTSRKNEKRVFGFESSSDLPLLKRTHF